MKNLLPEKTVERLSQCRRVLLNKLDQEKEFIFSHEIAKLLHLTPVQVRRDFMLMGYTGSPSKGYNIKKLIKAIGYTIDPDESQNAAVIGMGNLGKAISKYVEDKREFLKIVANFDVDEKKISKSVAGIKCHHIKDLSKVIRDLDITIAIITVPANDAYDVKELLVGNGIKGILNFTPAPLHVPDHIYLEEFDIITSLEKVAYFVKEK
ncbi:MAG: redox-sensing transcriptional repressor Rex [Bacteroidetes bacterium]|nr:redox-sensing transcriptional repressor Rex [Bacteroidota bacterium]MBL6962960.1 redox-sensing transcriptional repressor Rex [Bacteroidota bacterium]